MEAYPELRHLLTGVRVRLTPFRPADVKRMVETCVDPAVIKYTTVPHDYTAANTRELVANHPPAGTQRWAIRLADGKYVGSVALVNKEGRYEIGYMIHPDSRGNGYAVAAVNAVLAAMRTIQHRSVDLCIAEGNDASERVAEKCGFTRVGKYTDVDPRDGRLLTLTRFRLEL